MITGLQAASGKSYQLDVLEWGAFQYMDRGYMFDYVPQALRGCAHIRTCGNDKLLHEREECLRFETDRPVAVYLLYPDKQPVLPGWVEEYERLRMNVTRMDSCSVNLKGYFSLYRKAFEPGTVVLYGNSPAAMLANRDYIEAQGANYCMYSVAVQNQ